MVRADSAAIAHEFTDELHGARIGFLMGFDLAETVRTALLALPESVWRPAIDQAETSARARGWPRSPITST